MNKLQLKQDALNLIKKLSWETVPLEGIRYEQGKQDITIEFINLRQLPNRKAFGSVCVAKIYYSDTSPAEIMNGDGVIYYIVDCNLYSGKLVLENVTDRSKEALEIQKMYDIKDSDLRSHGIQILNCILYCIGEDIGTCIDCIDNSMCNMGMSVFGGWKYLSYEAINKVQYGKHMFEVTVMFDKDRDVTYGKVELKY